MTLDGAGEVVVELLQRRIAPNIIAQLVFQSL